MVPAELEFLAEDEIVKIVPRFKLDAFQLMNGNIGPFHPNVPISVPLWIAITLRQQQKCRIIPPDWLNIDFLNKCKEAEESPSCAVAPHPRYMEISTLLLQHAAEDVQNPESIRNVIRDLWDIRVGKLVSSVNGYLSSGSSTARVNQLTCMELANLRNILASSMDQLTVLRQAASQVADSGNYSRSSRSLLNYSVEN